MANVQISVRIKKQSETTPQQCQATPQQCQATPQQCQATPHQRQAELMSLFFLLSGD